jgi:hypothetical protein
MGVGVGLTLAVLDGAALASVDVTRAGMASGMFNSVRLTADTAAAAIAGSLLISLTAANLGGKVADPHAAADAANAGHFTTSADVGSAYSGALHVILWIGAVFAILTIPIVLATIRRDQMDEDELLVMPTHHPELQPAADC